jgi:hypothetical protein
LLKQGSGNKECHENLAADICGIDRLGPARGGKYAMRSMDRDFMTLFCWYRGERQRYG